MKVKQELSSPVVVGSLKRLAKVSSQLTSGMLLALVVVSALSGCEEPVTDDPVPENAIRIGAALPFSGAQASTGIHLERALMLAVQDVNDAGGVMGRPLYLKVRDSNSGSDRGAEQLRKLIEEDDVDYLIGPQEHNLALSVVSAIKRNDILHLLPSFTSPTISDSGSRGAWVRLAPSAPMMGCALATKAVQDGIKTTRTLAARDDYHLEMAAIFSSSLAKLGGRAFPTVTVASDESSYGRAISQINRYDADVTLMLAYPATGATIIKEMARAAEVRWYFSPMLRDEALLWNLPNGVLDKATGVSPSFSGNSDCTIQTGAGGAGAEAYGADCTAQAAERFAEYYAENWQGQVPLKAAHYYYDAVLMLSLALTRAQAEGNDDPRPQELLPYLVDQAEQSESIAWDSLAEGLELARKGIGSRYFGAAGEYEFNSRGSNVRTIVDTWIVSEQGQFVDRQSVICGLSSIED